ncbi:MAG: two-component system response regulator CreB [Candidatus Hydrogenedentes bacterium]|nr:two-component system response regulator CreB [Candidatus Hydrogenedentota bacterium]
MSGEILVVEDEPAIADTIVYALRTEGFTVTWHTTGGEALEAIGTRSFDLMVLDVGLPDASGFDICREVRKVSQLPIVFLTARAAEVDRIVGLEIGGDDYMAKPFSPRELTARVRAILRRTCPPVEVELVNRSASPWVIDQQRRSISYYGEALDLPRNEYKLLLILLQHPGWVYSRDQLMDLAWDAPDAAMARTVDTHIKTLRARLKKVRPDLDPIQTHRGVGYSLRELT